MNLILAQEAITTSFAGAIRFSVEIALMITFFGQIPPYLRKKKTFLAQKLIELDDFKVKVKL